MANIFLWVFIFSFSLIEYSYADSRFPILRDSKEQVQQGKLLYDQNCASCHKKNLSGTKDWRSVDSDGHTVPPPLNGTAHTWHHSDELLHDIIKHGFNNLIKNYHQWFNLKYEIVYFFNVYGLGQISNGNMATVLGIFEDQYKKNKPLTIVKPGTQTRRFTHINDTIDVCYYAWKKNRSKHYSISNRKSYTIIEVAKLFNTKIKFLPPREGERYASALTSMNLSNKVYKMFGKIDLKDYVENVVKNS